MAIAQQAQQPNRNPSKPKNPRFSHTDNTKYGMGDNYGSGVRQKMGNVRSDTVGIKKLSNKKIGTAPKSLA